MRYLTAFYWQQEEPASTSLVLQHFVYRRGKRQGLFACICTADLSGKGECNEFNFWAENLNHWFQRKGRAMFHRDVKNSTSETGNNLKMLIGRMNREFAHYCQSRRQLEGGLVDVTGLICEEEHFLLFYQGRQAAYLINSRFGKEHCKCLTKQQTESDLQGMELQLIEGRMEEQIAILLASREFGEHLTGRQIAECLSVEEITRTGNVQGRLRELGEEAVRKGGQHIGAVLLLTAPKLLNRRDSRKRRNQRDDNGEDGNREHE